MPSRNSKREFIVDHYYHIYNRSAHKSTIFNDRHDYATFMYLMKRYLTVNIKRSGYAETTTELVKNPRNLSEYVELNAFCLMPNHFHLLIRLKQKPGITKLMKGISNSYTSHFNNKYLHSGTLYESKYKMRMIETPDDLVNILKYIHNNPKEITKESKTYEWSSYMDYLGKRELTWLSKIGSDLN